MSEIINNSAKRKELLKHLILQLHNGEAPEQVKSRLIHLLHSVPYQEVVEVEQALIAEGLPEEEIFRFCDIHTAVLEGSIDTSAAKSVPAGHPVDTFKQENRALEQQIAAIRALLSDLAASQEELCDHHLFQLRGLLNGVSDVDKHYLRKEYLLFPFLEKAGITGPPVVMWGKHDETRALLKAAHEAIGATTLTKEELESVASFLLEPVFDAVEGMILKEEEILLPLSLDTLTEAQWGEIYEDTTIYGFCLYDPQTAWQPDVNQAEQPLTDSGDTIRLSSGSFDRKELEALFVTLPVDITFVDKNDKVKFFSHSPNRVFERNRSIIGRDVRMCHPPHSVHIVEQILQDFKSGKESKAAFWISNFKGGFVYIEYTALRDADQSYLGVIETTQDITELQKLSGDQRLLSYTST